jgi:hypothetical protein
MKRIPRRLFTEEFKREAIKLVTEQHLNVAAAGRQLDVAPKSIRSWIAESELHVLCCSEIEFKLSHGQRARSAAYHDIVIFKISEMFAKQI